jgi:hypothetical protein
MANATDTKRSGRRQEYGNKKTFVPWYQWIELSQEQKDKRIAEHQKERMSSNNGRPRTSYPPQQQANAHEVDEVVDIDDIIYYTMLNHDGPVDDDDDYKGNKADGDGLLAYIAGRSSSAGDICKVMATKTKISSKKYLDQMIGLITTIITYSTTVFYYFSSASKNLGLQAQFKQVGVIKPLV